MEFNPAELVTAGLNGLGGVIGLFDDSPAEEARSMMREQYQLQGSLMEKQAQLNSPKSIAQSYSKAGFNPYVAMGNGAGATGGQTSGGQISIPDAAYNVQEQQVGLLNSQTLSNLASAFKSSAEGSKIRSLLGSEIQRNLSQAGLNDVMSDVNGIERDLKKIYGKKVYEGQVGKMSAEIAELYAKANLAIASQDREDSETYLNQLESMIKQMNIKEADYNQRMAYVRLEMLPARLRQELKNLKAQESETYASAQQHRAESRQATSVAESNEFMLSIQKEPKVRIALCDQILQAAEIAKSQKLLNDKQADNIKWQTEQLKKATDNYEIMMWSNIINQSINTAANAVGEFTKFGLAKKFLQAPTNSSLHSGQGYMMQDGVLMLNPVK